MGGRYKKGWSKEHQKVFKMYIEGISPKDISEKTGFGIDKVRNIIKTDKFQSNHEQVINNSVETARKLLESKLVEAAGQIVKIMRQGKPEERLRFDAAKEVLYQCGMKPVEVVETRGRQYSPEEIQSSLTVIKEVQAIEEKLSTQGSGFLVQQDKNDVDASSQPVDLITNKDLPLTEAEVPADTIVLEPAGTKVG